MPATAATSSRTQRREMKQKGGRMINSDYEVRFNRAACMKHAPIGTLICDSYNNEWYPMKLVHQDTKKSLVSTIMAEYRLNYSATNTNIYLPWHYIVEMIDNDYYLINTRPLLYKTLIAGEEYKISICIIGDTNNEILLPKIYSQISSVLNSCSMNPAWRPTAFAFNKINFHNLGAEFDPRTLDSFLVT